MKHCASQRFVGCNRTLKKNKSKILPVVFFGFALILLSVGVSWLISKQLHEEISQEVQRSSNIANKMDIVASMAEIARTRTRLTMEMVYTEDIFDREAYGINAGFLFEVENIQIGFTRKIGMSNLYQDNQLGNIANDGSYFTIGINF